MRDGVVARVATQERFELAEGPTWDPVRGRLLWVDIEAGLVLVGELHDDGSIAVRERVSFGETVGAVAPAANGDWIVAGAERLYVRSADGAVRSGPQVIARGSRRLNDGKPDPAGRFVVGTTALEGGSVAEELVLVRGDEVVPIDRDLTLSNGLAWTADGRTLYSVDSERRVVSRRNWDPVEGTWGQRLVFLGLDQGYPDGICLDAEEHLWMAVWGLGQVRRYSPAGALVDTIEVPAPHTSSVAFAGSDLSTLVITTATRDLTADQLRAFSDSGRLFTVRLGVRGLPQALWAGPGQA